LNINGKEINGSLTNILTTIDDSLTSNTERIGNLETEVDNILDRSSLIEEKMAGLELSSASASAKLAENQKQMDGNTEEVKTLRERLTEVIQTTSDGYVKVAESIDSILSRLDNNTEEKAAINTSEEDIDLTPFETLLSEDVNTDTDIENISSENVTRLLLANRVAISDSLKVLGTSTFGDVNVKGTLSINGSLTINDDSISTTGALYIQNSPLANFVNIFNGAIIIESDGTISTIGDVDVLGNLNIEGAITTSATAGEDIESGDALYISGSQEVKVADATDIEKVQVIGLAASDTKVGRRVTVITGGKVAGMTELETGKKYYLGTDGKMTTEVPEDALKAVSLGIAFSDTELVVQISESSLSEVLIKDPELTPTPAAEQDNTASQSGVLTQTGTLTPTSTPTSSPAGQ
jgi:hypothetical protein